MRRLLTVLCTFVLLAVPLFAFQPPGQPGEFVPVNEVPAADQLPAAPLVIAAYAFVWIALLVYLWSIWRRLDRVERDLHALAARTDGSRAR